MNDLPPSSPEPKRRGCVFWGLSAFSCLVALGILSEALGLTPPPPQAAPTKDESAQKQAAAKQAAREAKADVDAAIARLSPAAIKDCDDNLTKLTKLGLVRDRQEPHRIDVDERLWEEMPYTQKQALLGLVSCSVFGQYLPPDGKWAVAYGWRDGEQKMILSSKGPL